MPLQNYGHIANSMATLPNPVDSFLGAKMGAEQNQRRNALVEADINRTNALTEQDRLGAQQGQHTAELKQALAKIRWMRQQGNLSGQLKAEPEKAAQLSQQLGVDVLSLPEDQLLEQFGRLEGHLASQLGEMPPDAAKVGVMPASVQEFEYAQKNPAFQQYQDRNRAQTGPAGPQTPAAVMEHEWFLRQPPEIQQQVLNYRRGNATPEIAAATAQARTEGTKAGERDAAVEKKIMDIGNLETLLDVASPMVMVATGSTSGAAADKVAGFFGASPSGADAIASLKIIQAQIMLSQPRMEGPQSDRDVVMYREAAGQLGDPMVPKSQKMAAIRTIRTLNAKYKSRNTGTPAPAASGAPSSTIKFDKNGNRIP